MNQVINAFNHHRVNRVTWLSQVKCAAGLALISTIATAFAFAGETINEEAVTSSTPNIEIEHVTGVATIKGWNKDQVKVTGELGKLSEKFIFEHDDNNVLIKIETKRYKQDWRSGDVSKGDKLTIFVPERSKISYTGVIANVEASELKSDGKFELVNGELSLTDLSGRLKVESVNADVAMKNLTGVLSVETVNGDISGNHRGSDDVRLMTVNGDIDFTAQTPTVAIESVNGDANITLGEIRSLSLTTVNGDMTASLNLLDDGDIDASSVGGTLSLNFQRQVSARFELQAHAGGDIKNRLSDDKPSAAKYGPSKWLNFNFNGGKGRVDMSTVNGELRIGTSGK